MTQNQITLRYAKKYASSNDAITKIFARYGDISFDILSFLLKNRGYNINPYSFEKNYQLQNELGSYNMLAEMLSDHNNVPIILVKFKGLDKSEISEWIEFLYHLLSYESVMILTYSNRNDKNTGYYSLNKIFLSLDNIHDEVVLKGRIYLDETYLPVMLKDVVYKDGKKLRGISRNKICIMTAVGGRGNMIIKSNGKGKPSKLRILEAFDNHIEEESTLVHDGENSHKSLIEKYNLIEEIHPNKLTKNLKDNDNPTNPIYSVHRRLKAFMREHGSYNRKNIQNWMNLIYFALSNQGDIKAI